MSAGDPSHNYEASLERHHARHDPAPDGLALMKGKSACQRQSVRLYLAIIAVTLLVFGCVPAIVVLQVGRLFGASATPAQLAELQMKRPGAVILPYDLRYNGAFKLQRVKEERPEVIWISSSRAGAFRASMFRPYRFYNMSFTAWTTKQLTDIFERTTRDVHPRVALISLDYFLFTDDWEKSNSGTRTMIYDHPFHYVKSGLVDFVRTAVQHRQVFENYLNAPTRFVGTQAILSQEGFRDDGSYVYSPGHIDYSRRHDKTADFLVSGMPGAPKMSDRQKTQIVRLSEIAQRRGVRLVAVQLPFIRAGVDYLDHKASYRYYSGVWRDFESQSTRDWLKHLGIPFFDLGRSAIDNDPANFFDAYHPSSLGSLKVMQKLLKIPEFRVLFPAIAPADIQRQLAHAESHEAME